jgi:hypothetical protein
MQARFSQILIASILDLAILAPYHTLVYLGLSLHLSFLLFTYRETGKDGGHVVTRLQKLQS